MVTGCRHLHGLILASLAAAVVLAGCQKKPSAGPTGAASVNGGALEGRLDILAWNGYLERGESDKNYDWVTPFEQSTGCKVNAITADTSDQMVKRMTAGGPDLVTASGDASVRLIRLGLVQAVDLARVPSFANVDERLRNGTWYVVDGKHYGVPYQWGPNVLLYNTKVFKNPPDSWSVVFEEQKLGDGRSNVGRTQAYEGPIAIADAALYLMSKSPELGIRDPYELNEQQYAAVLNLMRTQRALLHRYWGPEDQQVADFTAGTVVAASAWPYQVNKLIAAQQPVASVIPREGATGWADTTMLATKAAHPNCAYRWLEWSLNAKVQGDQAAWFGSVPAVPAACTSNALLGDTGCAVNGFNSFDKIHFWRTPEAQCSQGVCVDYSRWEKDFAQLAAPAVPPPPVNNGGVVPTTQRPG
jgi:putative spermidine/putrescine transport system substrate-binding protein